jgi:hypothetical protein
VRPAQRLWSLGKVQFERRYATVSFLVDTGLERPAYSRHGATRLEVSPVRQAAVTALGESKEWAVTDRPYNV